MVPSRDPRVCRVRNVTPSSNASSSIHLEENQGESTKQAPLVKGPLLAPAGCSCKSWCFLCISSQLLRPSQPVIILPVMVLSATLKNSYLTQTWVQSLSLSSLEAPCNGLLTFPSPLIALVPSRHYLAALSVSLSATPASLSSSLSVRPHSPCCSANLSILKLELELIFVIPQLMWKG